MFANCVHTKTLFVHVSDREFFSRNSSKFAIECDWNSKNSPNDQNLGFYGKIDVFFSNLENFQNPDMWHFFPNAFPIVLFLNSFHLIFGVFLAENQKKFKVGKIRKYDEETE